MHISAQRESPWVPCMAFLVSLKDQFHVKGIETTMGYVGWVGTFEDKKDDLRAKVIEGKLVRELRRARATVFCKTSVPLTLMAGETANNIIGYTWNPKTRRLSSRGSPGGEGARIALRGSPAGFGLTLEEVYGFRLLSMVFSVSIYPREECRMKEPRIP